MIKEAKEQLRAHPHPLTYGLLRYLNTDVELDGPTRRSASITWDVWVPPRPRSPMRCGVSVPRACR
ncbi:linear gramicidin synthetase subunit C domain protein [Mycobacterium xenopi 4042]|uniref:Linear gramicidin synthetase subunit C domain protein n=1 Tax=Mycobacterium xenopi 4042 TaxID=1299334 RepID=X8E6I8_MYCXE|nr:linear gramicidin synthetase subunit C domain protein [Mycobacterium xenopi 4042]